MKASSGEVQFLGLSERCTRELVQIDVEWNPRPWSEQGFREELLSPVVRSLGAFNGPLVIGYILAQVVLDEAHITTFGVASAWQGQGVGGRLLRAFLEDLKGGGVRVVTLEVRRGNTIGQRVYAAVGFGVAGVRPAFYEDNGEDAFTMRLEW